MSISGKPGRRTATRNVGSIVLTALLTACTALGESDAPTSASVAQVRSVAAQLPTSLPDASFTTAQMVELVSSTQPEAVRQLELGAEVIQSIYDFGARMVAATRLAPDQLCRPDGDRPFYGFLTDPSRAEAVERDIDSSALDAALARVLDLDATTCQQVRLVGPGIVAGPATWSLREGFDDEVQLDYLGRFTYLLGNDERLPTPVTFEFRNTFVLQPQGEGWGVRTVPRAFYYAGELRTDVPVPDGYLLEPDEPLTGDEEAVEALRAAVATWSDALGASTFASTEYRYDQERDEPYVRRFTGSPRRGDGTMTNLVRADDTEGPGEGGGQTLTTGRGEKVYFPRDEDDDYEAVPFTQGAPDANWLVSDKTRGGGRFVFDNAELMDAAFGWADALERADVVVPLPCEEFQQSDAEIADLEVQAEPTRCLLAAVPTVQPDDPEGDWLSWGGRLAGPRLLVEVALGDSGQLLQAHSEYTFPQPVGKPTDVVQHAWFTTSDTSPPTVSVPPSTQVTNSEWVYIDED